MGKVYFQEEQKFRQPWIWVIVSISALVWLYAVLSSYYFDKQEGNTNSDLIVLIIGIVPVIIIYLFFKVKLTTIVDNSGIHYRFAPFQTKSRIISPGDIDNYTIRKYKPLVEYGGWGIRIGRGRRGTAYNVSGNIGMQFEFNNGKKFLLGTQEPKTFKRAVDKIMS